MIHTLASTASVSPMDTSALGASISALKSSISALESSIKTLEGSSGRWETLAWVCAFAVGVGIVGEIVVIVGEHWDDRTDWARGIIRPPDHPSVRRFWFDIGATILVLVGVFGEAGASMQLASVNSRLRSKTSELRAKSDQLLAFVTLEMGSLASSAEKASLASNEAETKANSAGLKASIVSAKADAVSSELSDLESRMAWRGVSDDQKKELQVFLRPLRGTPVDLMWETSDIEADTFALQLFGALKSSGVNVEPDASGSIMTDAGISSVEGFLLSGNLPGEIVMSGALVCSSLANAPVKKQDNGGKLTIMIRPKGQHAISMTDKTKHECESLRKAVLARYPQ